MEKFALTRAFLNIGETQEKIPTEAWQGTEEFPFTSQLGQEVRRSRDRYGGLLCCCDFKRFHRPLEQGEDVIDKLMESVRRT